MTDELQNDIERRLRFAWHWGRLVSGSARPGRFGPVEAELAWLQTQGVHTIVNLCSEPFIPPPGFVAAFEYVHLPVTDCHPPTLEQVERALELVRDRTGQGRAVLIHCRGGVGRTATALTPVLMELGGLSLTEAVEELRRAGRLTQSMEQWRFLEAWAESRLR
jgi:hypothetical protein